jgi:hypothetical protein
MAEHHRSTATAWAAQSPASKCPSKAMGMIFISRIRSTHKTEKTKKIFGRHLAHLPNRSAGNQPLFQLFLSQYY